MTYIKPIQGYTSTYAACRYLEHGTAGDLERAVARDSNFDPDGSLYGDRWWKHLDAVRREYGHDEKTRTGRSRSYEHYVIATDPADVAALGHDECLERLRSVVGGFADAYLGDVNWVAVYHDDGANGNIHAHLVVGCTDLATGKKRSETKSDFDRAKALCDRLCREHGLSALVDRAEPEEELAETVRAMNARRSARGEEPVVPSGGRAGTSWPTVESMAERGIRARRGSSWKADIRAAADTCAAAAASFEEFRYYMASMGYAVRANRAGELVYTWRDGKRKVRAGKLGALYSTDVLACRFMDLRFTRSGWRAGRRDYAGLDELGRRIPKIDVGSVSRAVGTLVGYGVYGDIRDAELVLQGLRRRAAAEADAADAAAAARRAAERDLADARAVEAMAPTMEAYRSGGRLSGMVPPDVASAEDVSAYEAARKRLARRSGPTDAAGLTRRLASLEAVMSAHAEASAALSADVADLSRSISLMREVDRAVADGARREAERYPSRLALASSLSSRRATAAASGRVPGAAGDYGTAAGAAASAAGRDRAAAEVQEVLSHEAAGEHVPATDGVRDAAAALAASAAEREAAEAREAASHEPPAPGPDPSRAGAQPRADK